MTHSPRIPAGLLACAAIFGQAYAGERSEWSVDVLVGDAFNVRSRTRIDTDERASAAISGDYETRGLEGPLHYAVRVTRWEEGRGWGLELLHHKLFLQNRPAGVESLSVSHGFNILAVERAYALDPWQLRIGIGPVIAHPEARIDGASYDGPYELAGAAALASIGVSVALTSRLSLIGQAAATFGYISVHPRGDPDLQFSIRNPAVHAQVGLGYRFR